LGEINTWADLGMQVGLTLATFAPIAWFGLLGKSDRRITAKLIGFRSQSSAIGSSVEEGGSHEHP
jgi:hypothetical protein